MIQTRSRSHSELADMRRMAQEAIEEGSPYADRLSQLVQDYTTQMNGAPEYAPVDDDDERGGYVGGNKQMPRQAQKASEKQVAFLHRLISEKDTTGLTIPAQIEGISKTAASALIDRLLGRSDKMTPDNAATEKQIAFLRKLTAERDSSGLTIPSNPTKPDAKRLIDHLLAAPYAPRPVVAELESGIYQTTAGEIFKVYLNQGKDRLLAKRLNIPAGWENLTREERESALERPEWAYAGMANRFVVLEQKMALEDAVKFGAIYGVCCNCGRMLTNEDSIEAGIGPVCAGRFK